MKKVIVCLTIFSALSLYGTYTEHLSINHNQRETPITITMKKEGKRTIYNLSVFDKTTVHDIKTYFRLQEDIPMNCQQLHIVCSVKLSHQQIHEDAFKSKMYAFPVDNKCNMKSLITCFESENFELTCHS